MLDWVIRGGTVIDGSGGAPFRADIGIRSGKIAAVGSCGEAAQTLDAAGLPKSAYDNFLSQLRTEVPVISANHVTLSDGTFTTASKQKDLLYDYQTLQYYLLFD